MSAAAAADKSTPIPSSPPPKEGHISSDLPFLSSPAIMSAAAAADKPIPSSPPKPRNISYTRIPSSLSNDKIMGSSARNFETSYYADITIDGKTQRQCVHKHRNGLIVVTPGFSLRRAPDKSQQHLTLLCSAPGESDEKQKAGGKKKKARKRNRKGEENDAFIPIATWGDTTLYRCCVGGSVIETGDPKTILEIAVGLSDQGDDDARSYVAIFKDAFLQVDSDWDDNNQGKKRKKGKGDDRTDVSDKKKKIESNTK